MERMLLSCGNTLSNKGFEAGAEGYLRNLIYGLGKRFEDYRQVGEEESTALSVKTQGLLQFDLRITGL